MRCASLAPFILMLRISVSLCRLPDTSRWSFNWMEYYRGRRERENRLPEPDDWCVWEWFGWTNYRCSSPWHFQPEQSNGKDKWCVERHGAPIAYTLEKIKNFPYDCRKTRDCPKGTVYETTGRCEENCTYAVEAGYRNQFKCRNKCICPRGKYRNKDGRCVWLDNCPKPSCMPPMVYKACVQCRPTCATPTPLCNRGCQEGQHCVCPDDMVQISTENPRCFKVEECPECEHGALPTDELPRCPETCFNKASCDERDQRLGCICPPGKVRLDLELPVRCVSNHECPQCNAPAVAVKCTMSCPPSCEATGPVCLRPCKSDYVCGCKNGYVQRSRTEVDCIRPEQCPPKCDEPKEYKECASICQPTCQVPKAASCRRGCSKQLCICPKTMVQLSEEDTICVDPLECPTCVAPGKPTRCTGTCPATCDMPEPESDCEFECDTNYVCTCPDGYVRRSLIDPECVKLDDCPKDCPAPKVYERCPSKCQPTCQDPEPNPDDCDSECREDDCVCPKGTILLNAMSSECIKPSQCPNCTAPAMAVECTGVCPETCEPASFLCVRQCASTYVCGCPEGYALTEKDGNECVKKEDCPPPCNPPKRYANCASLCQPTCQVPEPKFCKRGCNPRRCFCPKGMVQPAEDDFSCIFLSDCPKNCTAPKIFEKCPSKCQPTCENLEPESCESGCREDECICPNGMVLLSEESDTCVKLSRCPKRCEHPEVSVNCRTTCPVRCDNLETLDISDCDLECGEQVCVCADEYIQRSESDPTCIPVSSCPPPPRCKYPEVPVTCRSTCVVTCDNLATLDVLDCAAECGDEVCVCDDGYVRRSNSNATCVEVFSCPPPPTPPPPDSDLCDSPKVYVACATKCPPTCEEPNPQVCSRACDPTVECQCPIGMVQRDKTNTTCLKMEDCPVCEKPKIYAECASKCRPTCQTPNPVFCDESCDPDIHCICPPGMVHPKNGDDDCIDISDCPKSCKFPTVPTECAPKCPATCDDPAPSCEKGCDTDVKCVCPNGLLRPSLNDSSCVLPSQCPGLPENCPLRKIPTACASGCPATCDSQNQRFCTKPCRADVKCECPRGMVQKSLEDDTCLWPYQCEP